MANANHGVTSSTSALEILDTSSMECNFSSPALASHCFERARMCPLTRSITSSGLSIREISAPRAGVSSSSTSDPLLVLLKLASESNRIGNVGQLFCSSCEVLTVMPDRLCSKGRKQSAKSEKLLGSRAWLTSSLERTAIRGDSVRWIWYAASRPRLAVLDDEGSILPLKTWTMWCLREM